VRIKQTLSSDERGAQHATSLHHWSVPTSNALLRPSADITVREILRILKQASSLTSLRTTSWHMGGKHNLVTRTGLPLPQDA
jgi:hypothetical protein